MDPEETTPETAEETAPETTPEAAPAEAILSSVYEAKIATLTAENLSLTAALVQAKADNYDLLMSQAGTAEVESDSDSEAEPEDDDFDQAFN